MGLSARAMFAFGRVDMVSNCKYLYNTRSDRGSTVQYFVFFFLALCGCKTAYT